MFLAVHLGEIGTFFLEQVVNIRSIGVTDDLFVILVFLDNNDDVIIDRQTGRPGKISILRSCCRVRSRMANQWARRHEKKGEKEHKWFHSGFSCYGFSVLKLPGFPQGDLRLR